MTQNFVSEIIALEARDGFSGSVTIVQNAQGSGKKQGFLTGACYGTGRRKVEIDQHNSVFEFSIPTSVARIIFRPQIRTLIVKTGRKERSISFDNRLALKVLAKKLRKDAVYKTCSLAFYVAAISRMIDVEKQYQIHFPALEEINESRASFQERAGTILLQRGGDKEDKGGWLGVDLTCFIPCMRDCEEDHEWYEVWWHAFCLFKCGLKCGTGGGILKPEN